MNVTLTYKKHYMNKTKILQQIIAEQDKTINNLTSSIKKYKIASDLDENNTLDPEDFSNQGEAMDMKMRLEQLLVKEIRNKEIIEKCLNLDNKVVELGALVDLDIKYLFVGASTHTLKADGKEIYTISEDAPIYQSIKGKKVGDKIELGNLHFVIKDIK